MPRAECLTLAPGSDRILVELFQILKDDAVESAALNMQYALYMQYAGSQHNKYLQTVDSLVKSLILGKIESRRRRGHQRMTWLDGITDARDINMGKLQEMMRDREACPCRHTAVHGVAKSDMTGRLNNNTK